MAVRVSPAESRAELETGSARQPRRRLHRDSPLVYPSGLSDASPGRPESFARSRSEPASIPRNPESYPLSEPARSPAQASIAVNSADFREPALERTAKSNSKQSRQ